ncbi:hypothetical protein PQS31_05365 [Luteimonas sp BLCC-B24]|uniref:hypothetical protein n=1 Tax=Luteimonas sp. BLCC-B24 TaxID=3025317 RepID=UPI00234D2BF7|nr:hypothetical protein [Luteimonas sp. BLCC-B24]MDC7806251.1 hypothetical protein [Luteimonas sp. BLCC-B24]
MRVESAVAVAGVGASSEMRPRRRAFDWMLLLLIAASTFAAQLASAQESAGDASEESANPVETQRGEKICQYEDITGSRMRKRVCFTQERWDAREMAAKNLVRDLDAKPVAGENNAGPGR